MQIPTDRHVAEISFYIRFAETDQMGIVHHSSYVVYAEELRMQYMRDVSVPYTRLEEIGLGFAVSGMEYRYLSPAVFGQKLMVKGWITEFKSRRVTFAYLMLNPDTDVVHVRATSDQILVDREGNVRRIPDFLVNSSGIENL